MRNTSNCPEFPYTAKNLCYFEVDKNGEVNRISHYRKSDLMCVKEDYQRAKERETTLYAVWPGKWTSDLFIIDDLNLFARAMDLE